MYRKLHGYGCDPDAVAFRFENYQIPCQSQIINASTVYIVYTLI